jgi:hypothetical protein
MSAAGFEKFNSENIIVTATHTHTAPEVRSSRKGYNPEYISFAVVKTLEALKMALSNLEPCTAEYGMTADNRFSFNRRYWMANGKVLTNPGKLNPDIVRPEGEIDPEMPLLAFRCKEKIKVLIVNIVNHADTVGGNLISGDWPGFTIRAIQKKIGAGSMALPLIGCSGNINHFDVRNALEQTSYSEAERIGTGYAETILKALDSLSPISDFDLKTFSLQVIIPPRELSVEEIEQAQKVIDKYPEIDVNKVGGPDLTAEDLARKTPFALKFFAAALLKMAKERESESFDLTRIDIGDVAIISVPCEPFVEIGLSIKKGISEKGKAMAASLSNGSGTGYIPNCWNYGRGGYETTPRSNPFSIKTSEKLLGAYRKIQKEMAKK